MTETWTLFDRLADRYDQVIPFFAGFAAQLLDVIDPAPGTRLLDIGSGRGAVAAAAVARDHLDIPLALHEAGFVDVRAVDIAVHLPVSDPQTCWDFHMSHGFAARVEALSPADAAEFRRRALAELTRMHHSGGIVVDRGATIHLATNRRRP